MPTEFAPSMSAPDMLSSPELGLDGINVKHNALVNKVSHVVETVDAMKAKLAVYEEVRASRVACCARPAPRRSLVLSLLSSSLPLHAGLRHVGGIRCRRRRRRRRRGLGVRSSLLCLLSYGSLGEPRTWRAQGRAVIVLVAGHRARDIPRPGQVWRARPMSGYDIRVHIQYY